MLANAGIAATGFTRSIDPAAFERVINVDLLGVWRTVRVTLPHLIESKGYALLVSSAAAIVHIPGNAAYSAAKAGVEAFANSLRAEVKHLGVDVGVVHPTWIATDMVNNADEHPVFGRLRRSNEGLAGKTYPLSVAVDLIGAGIAKRARVVHVPGWVGVAKLFRALLPRVVERQARKLVPAADKAALEDIAERGAVESSLVGPGRAELRPQRGCAITRCHVVATWPDPDDHRRGDQRPSSRRARSRTSRRSGRTGGRTWCRSGTSRAGDVHRDVDVPPSRRRPRTCAGCRRRRSSSRPATPTRSCAASRWSATSSWSRTPRRSRRSASS